MALAELKWIQGLVGVWWRLRQVDEDVRETRT